MFPLSFIRSEIRKCMAVCAMATHFGSGIKMPVSKLLLSLLLVPAYVKTYLVYTSASSLPKKEK